MRLIALCGYPKAGKSTVQKLITERYGFKTVDDSRPLRDAAKILFSLSEWHVNTQEGKSQTIRTLDGEKTIRQILGELGDHAERIDPFALPRRAIEAIRQNDPTGDFVFASVRKSQNAYLKSEHDAFIIEVRRRGCTALGDFDRYDRAPIDLTIDNDFMNTAQLRHALAARLDKIFLPTCQAAS